MKTTIGINYYFSKKEIHDQAFQDKAATGSVGVAKSFKEWVEQRYDVEVHTWDNVDWTAEDVKAVLYFDYSWRYARQDQILRKIPYEKRALTIIEPANVNPSLYYIPFYRNRFKTIFTWDEKLLRRHKDYIPINVPVGAEPTTYSTDRFADIRFADKKLLVAVSRNRWSYMPQSTYKKRIAAYRYFAERQPIQFDLFGQGWSALDFKPYRGEIQGEWDAKVATMANYKFALCFENNASQPGYISEKILDCFCARCVPIYYGSRGIEKRIPRECFIDCHDFKNFQDLENYILSMSEAEHAHYVNAINQFMKSPAANFFSTDHYFRTLAEGLGLKRREDAEPANS